MKQGWPVAISIKSLFKALRFPLGGLALSVSVDGPRSSAWGQNTNNNNPSETRAWAPGAIEHAQKMRSHKDADIGSQPTPGLIPRFEVDGDSSGKIATFQPGGPTFTEYNAFFQNLGTNGRTCFTCHQPQNGWTVSAADVHTRFNASSGTDPIFRLVDGATCPTDKVKTLEDKRKAYKLLIDKGLIRIGLPLPDAPKLQFEVTKVDDPYDCSSNKAIGLTSKTAGIVSVYRRPLPWTNFGFLSTIMWDGREPDLESQAIDATLTHAQGNPTSPPTVEQQEQIVDFETGIFTAQIFDNEAQDLHARHVTGGPVALSLELPKPCGRSPGSAGEAAIV